MATININPNSLKINPVIFKLVWIIPVFLIVLFLFSSTLQINSPTEISVVTTLGKIDGIRYSGPYFKFPLISKSIKYDTTVQSIECIDAKGKDNCQTLDASTKDLQDVRAAVQVSYKIDPNQLKNLYLLIQDQNTFNNNIVPSTVAESLKVTTARYTSEELITRRGEVKEVLEKELQSRLDKFYLQVVSVNIVNFSFSQAFNQEIEKKAATAQQVLQKEAELKKVEAENQIAISKAETQAKTRQLEAEAEAKALEATAKVIRENPQTIEMEKIKKWDGKLPQVQGGNGTIIDIGSIKD